VSGSNTYAPLSGPDGTTIVFRSSTACPAIRPGLIRAPIAERMMVKVAECYHEYRSDCPFLGSPKPI
jgi:hypothetical protein